MVRCVRARCEQSIVESLQRKQPLFRLRRQRLFYKMSSDEINVFRCETELDSSVPVWKKDILERRKAKSRGTFDSFSSAFAARINDEIHGENGRSEKSSPTFNGNFTFTSTSRHFAGKRAFTPDLLSPLKTNKPWSAFDHCDITTPDKNVCCHGEQESLVLSDSLGPLHDNPFIKMERQRKKHRDQENAARSIQHILEVYGSVPGVRTIRAENIIIIESDPDYLLEPPDFKTGAKLQHNGRYSSIKDLLDQNCTAVTEIHAKEVVIYNSKLSRSEENLSTLGHYGTDGELVHMQGKGRVNRMLQKFDCNYDKLQPRSRSSENLLDADTSSNRLRLHPKPQVDPVPKCVTPPRSTSPALSPEPAPIHLVFQSSKPSQRMPQTLSFVEKQESGIPFSVSLQSEEKGEYKTPVNLRSQTKPLSEKGWDAPEESSKPKVPSYLERRRDVPEGPSCRPSLRSSTFEIRPSPRPDLSTLPVDDVQARALANLRLQSRNSFTVIPKRRMPTVSSVRAVPSSPIKPTCDSPCPHPSAPEPQTTTVPKPTPPALPPPSPRPPVIQEEIVPGHAIAEPPEPHVPVNPCTSPSPSTVDLMSDPPMQVMLPEEPLCIDQLPVTNIDDVVVEPVRGATSSLVLQRKGNTFTVVPKRRPDPQAWSPEPQGPAADQLHPTQVPKQPPYAELGSLLKKRYPKAEEIEVIGGYLSLSRSCLSKTPTRKKLKISFNESSLHSTFEYPSESSLVDGGEIENEGEVEEGGPAIKRFLIPRPSYISSPSNTTSSIDLSSYTPKHSVDFSAWQEDKHDVHVFSGDCNAECTEQSLEEVMLIPGDRPTLSDFHSDPALYF
ncbi:taperin-like [Anguilla anguilla]|uniref:taperin-like n=1 Tax=Anguilla anguilla TaxID=7936 RepID=UPI0015AB2C74|nr:taperin-like [Anguilla anguilla]